MPVAYPTTGADGKPFLFYAERGTLVEKPFRNVNSFQPDSGPAFDSRRSSFASIFLTFNMALSNADLETLRTFYRDACGDGTLTFGPMPHPRTLVSTLFRWTAAINSNDLGWDKNTVNIAIRTVLF